MAACADPTAARTAGTAVGLEDPEVLRALLLRLHRDGPGAWRHDPEAQELMRHCISRYGPMARKYGHEQADAATAAFEVLRQRATRHADNPWAVVTTAVRRTFIAEWRADELLTSASRARRPEFSHLPTVERIGDRTTIEPEAADARDDDEPRGGDGDQIDRLVGQTAALLVALGWPTFSTCRGIGYICERLADLGSRPAAYEALRRDSAARAALGMRHRDWVQLLRALLGHPTLHGVARHGLLARILAGDALTTLLTDPEVIDAAAIPPAPLLVGARRG
jgi:hypothetical protein